MLGLFKLQRKKKSLCTNPVSYKTSRAGHREGGGGHPGQVAGCQEERGARKKRAPERKGPIVLTGGCEGTSEERDSGAGRAGAFSTRAQCWRGHGATACPPLALGEPVTHEPLARQAPSEIRTTAVPPTITPFPKAPPGQPSQNLGLNTPHSPLTCCSPPHFRARAAGETAGWKVGVERWVVQLLPPLKIQKKKSASKVNNHRVKIYPQTAPEIPTGESSIGWEAGEAGWATVPPHHPPRGSRTVSVNSPDSPGLRKQGLGPWWEGRVVRTPAWGSPGQPRSAGSQLW